VHGQKSFDAVFVGAGVNSLVGAALLAQAGWGVCVLERAEVPGGCIRTSSELTLPGFTHELMACWHPLFTGSAAYAELRGSRGAPRGH
jgi:phytoene dehydrogenase-like protein